MNELQGIQHPQVLRRSPYNEWFEPEFNNYKPEKLTVNKLRGIIDSNIRALLFFGSWCEDSHVQVPRIIKLVQALKLPMASVELVAINEDKNEPRNAIRLHQIQFVPTLIVFRNHQEIGRITEQPKNKSLEDDLLDILTL